MQQSRRKSLPPNLLSAPLSSEECFMSSISDSVMDVIMPVGEARNRPSRPSSHGRKLRPKGESIHVRTGGPVSAPWEGNTHWGRKRSPWSAMLRKTSREERRASLPVIDATHASAHVLPHSLGRGACSCSGKPPLHGKPCTNGRKISDDSTVSTEASETDGNLTQRSWADQLASLAACKATVPEPVMPVMTTQVEFDPNIEIRAPATLPISKRPSPRLKPPSSSSPKSDSSNLAPPRDGPAAESETWTEVPLCEECDATTSNGASETLSDLTAANVAMLGTDPDIEHDSARKKVSPKKRILSKLFNSSAGKSTQSCDSPLSEKSAKTTKSDGSNLSNLSNKSFGMKAMGQVMRAVQRFQRPLRQSTHAHRGRYECQYCFEDLDTSAVAVLVGRSGIRSCQHLLHQDCCTALQERAKKNGMKSKARCPCCTKSFESVVNLPDPLTETEAWFEALDFEGRGKVEKNDIMDHLMAVMPVKTALRDTLAPAPQKINLSSCQALIDRLKTHATKTRRTRPPTLPDIEKQSEWFNFWDIHEDGVLNRASATRALMKSLKFDKLLLRAAIDDVWLEEMTRRSEEVTSGKDVVESVSKDDLFRLNGGLVARVLKHVQAAQKRKVWQELTPM